MKSVAVASPNHGSRPAGVSVDTVVLHADAAANAQATVSWIRSKVSKVSYHALIDRDGTVYRFVETSRRAWHCGPSAFDGRTDVNDFSLGLSFANRNDGAEPYTDAQYESAALVLLGWMQLYPKITAARLTTHAAIATPPGRKTDPMGFDLERLKALL